MYTDGTVLCCAVCSTVCVEYILVGYHIHACAMPCTRDNTHPRALSLSSAVLQLPMYVHTNIQTLSAPDTSLFFALVSPLTCNKYARRCNAAASTTPGTRISNGLDLHTAVRPEQPIHVSSYRLLSLLKRRRRGPAGRLLIAALHHG